MSENYLIFNALYGVQGRKASYYIQVPLKVLAMLFREENSSLSVEQRSQRTLNKSRVSQISKYILDNPNTYVLPPLVAYIRNGEIDFQKDSNSLSLGKLRISLNADLFLFDGQHRKAAIVNAITQRQFLGDETIGVMLLSNDGLTSAQQVFADININAIKPAQSIKLLYNHRDKFSAITRNLIDVVPLFRDYTDFEKTNLLIGSEKLFTFSSIYQANKELFVDSAEGDDDDRLALAIGFWRQVAASIKEWVLLVEKNILPAELRQNHVHAHGVVLSAIAQVGAILISQYPADWSKYVELFSQVDWQKQNINWQGRCIVLGRVCKSRQNVMLTANYIMQAIGVSLPVKHMKIEEVFV